MSRVKVLNCITGLNIGGAKYILARYLRQIDREKFDPSVLTLMAPGPLKHHITDLNIELAGIGMSESKLSLAAFRNLRREFNRSKPDLIHSLMHHGNRNMPPQFPIDC